MTHNIPFSFIPLIDLCQQGPDQVGSATVRLIDMKVSVAVSEPWQVNGYNQITRIYHCIDVVAPAKCGSAETMNQ
jgi:hypothetical protein